MSPWLGGYGRPPPVYLTLNKLSYLISIHYHTQKQKKNKNYLR